MKWTNETDNELRRLLALGVRDSEIGVALGVSKNSIIGRRHRLGIILTQRAAPRPPVRRARDAKVIQFPPKPQPPRPEPQPEPPADCPAATADPISFGAIELPPTDRLDGGWPLLGIPKGGCKWPVTPHTVREHLFCGEPAVEDKPYCLDHCRIAYLPPKPAPAHKSSTAERRRDRVFS